MEVFLKDKSSGIGKKSFGQSDGAGFSVHIIYEIFVPMWSAKVLAAALLDSKRGYKRLLVDITSPSDKPLMLGFSPIRASGGTMAICDWSIVSRETKAVINLVMEYHWKLFGLVFSQE